MAFVISALALSEFNSDPRSLGNEEARASTDLSIIFVLPKGLIIPVGTGQ